MIDPSRKILEWLSLAKGTNRELLGYYKGVPVFTTEHFKQRVAERYPWDIRAILRLPLEVFYHDCATEFLKNQKSVPRDGKEYKGVVDYTTKCVNHQKKQFIINLAVNYVIKPISSGNRENDRKLIDAYEKVTKAKDRNEKAKALSQYTQLVRTLIDPRYQEDYLSGRLKVGEFSVALMSIFGSVATPEDIARKQFRTIRPSSDTVYFAKRQLPKTHFSANEYRRLVKWSIDNITRAARSRKMADVKVTNESIIF